MRLAVLDTNVIVAAGIKQDGAPAQIIMDWVLEGPVQLAVCPLVIDEYRKVMQRPKFHRYGFPPFWLEFVIEEGLSLPDPADWPYPGPDPKDLPFLALSHTAGAWLVTGNIRHFPESSRGGVTVLSPADYLADLTKSTGPKR